MKFSTSYEYRPGQYCTSYYSYPNWTKQTWLEASERVIEVSERPKFKLEIHEK